MAAGLAFQALTYLCAALVWKAAMVNIGIHFPLSQLVPLSVAKLFSDQVLPSGGLSGSAFFTVALKHRGVAVLDGLVALVASLTGYYASYMIMAVASLALLAFRHDIHPWILTASVLFFVVALAVPAVVILAAGRASRMGGRPKVLLSWEGRTLVTRAVETAGSLQASGPVIVVIGHEAERVKAELDRAGAAGGFPRILVVRNPCPEEGMGSSLRRGALAAGPRDLVVMLADQPLVTTATVTSPPARA